MLETSIPFNNQFQSNLLILLIQDYEFLKTVAEDLSPKLLDAGEGHLKLLKLILFLYKQHKRPLSIEIVRNAILQGQRAKVYSDGDAFGMNSIISSGKLASHSELAYIKEKCYDFIKKQTMALAFSKAIDAFEKNDYDTVYGLVGDAYKKSFGNEYSMGINYAAESVCDRYLEAPRKGVWSTGFPTLDGYFAGGIAKKECLTVISSSGRGKTALLCNFAVSAAKQNRKTVFITLEMSELQIAQRFDSIISGFSSNELSTLSEAKVTLQKKLDTLFPTNVNNLLSVKGFDRGTLSLGGFETYLDKYCNEYGEPDVVIADWLGCFKLSATSEKKYEALAEVGDGLVNLSRKFNCSLLTAHQSNRQAVGNSVFGYDAISESFASIFGFDFVIGLGSSEKAMDAGMRTLTIQKSRVGPDSLSVLLSGSKPNEPLTFKFEECVGEEEETEIIQTENRREYKNKK